MKGFYLIAAILAALPIHAAYAQDEADPPAPPAGGFRAELVLGYDTDGFEDGMIYGGRIGYDFQVAPNFLLGVDGEFSDVTTEQEFLLAPQPGALVLQDGPDFYVGARATLAVSRRFNLYGGAGLSHARQSFFFLINPQGPLGPLGPVGGEESYFDGYRLTAGGQLNIARRAFLGAEYRYSSYDDGFFQREQWVGTLGFRF